MFIGAKRPAVSGKRARVPDRLAGPEKRFRRDAFYGLDSSTDLSYISAKSISKGRAKWARAGKR
jgi:hypothetical protein